jgi:magnesium-transporting ATPase (P-type)
MTRPNPFLIAGGVMSALVAVLHILFAIQPELYRYVSPSQESGLAQLASQGAGIIIIVSFAIALIFAMWAVYAFSAAELTRRLPLMRTVLIGCGVIYILRALFLPTEIQMVATQGYPFRFVVFSTYSLAAGVLYLTGLIQQRAVLKGKQAKR